VAVLGTTALACLAASSASAGIADPDPSFGSGGTVSLPFDHETRDPVVEVAPDGDIVLAGSIRAAGEDWDTQIVRLAPDGSPVEEFAGDGVLTLDLGEGEDASAPVIAVTPDGTVVVAVQVDDKIVVEQVLPDGSRDAEYAGDGAAVFSLGELGSGAPTDVEVDDAGRAVIAGTAIQPGSGQDAGVARLTTAGELDPGFAEDGTIALTTCPDPLQTETYACVEEGGSLYIAPNGDIELFGSTFVIPRGTGFYAALDPNGTAKEVIHTDDTWDSDVAVLPDSSALVLGNVDHGLTRSVSASLRRADGSGEDWLYDARPDPNLGDGTARGSSVAALSDGRAIVAGWRDPQGAAKPGGQLFLIDPSSEEGFVQAGPMNAVDVGGTGGGGYVVTQHLASDWVVKGFLAPSFDAPQTRIAAGPRGKIRRNRVAFRFGAVADATQLEFECRLDGRRWRACRSPESLRRLRKGRHRFRVRAIAHGTADPTPAKRRFRIR